EKSLLGRLKNRLLHTFWFVHPGHSLRIEMTPSQVYTILEQATRPSIERLHLRSTFAQGRRYLVNPLPGGGFRMMTTSRRTLSRRRTTATAVLVGNFPEQEAFSSALSIRSRIRIWYLLDVLLLPTFMASILVFMPWHPGLIAGLLVLLYGLNWLIHRSNAALEAHEMIYFVEKVLQEHLYDAPPQLHEKSADLVYERNFAQAWDKFYEEVREGDS
ncbi:MAG: hypothetical protein KC496_20805, partial [Anaerolineae bacterium]|nr:hypothetical protein [Anaerolineae bacterium]